MDAETPFAYKDGTIIEYTSFDVSGYSVGQVVRYAPASEQTRTCPNCEQLAVPRAGPEGSLRECPRCLALARFPALDPLVYIRDNSGEKPFPVRESQLRRLPAAAPGSGRAGRRELEEAAGESCCRDHDPEELPEHYPAPGGTDPVRRAPRVE